MKYRLIALLLGMVLLLFSSLFAQAPDTLWTKKYGSKGCRCYGFSVQEITNNEGYLVAGSVYRDGNWDVIVLKCDIDGNIDLTKTYNGSQYDYVEQMQRTNDGCFIIAVDGLFNLMKINANGDTLWTMYTETPKEIGLGHISAVQQTSDSGYIIIGNETESCGDGPQYVRMMKADKYGKKLWIKQYSNKGKEIFGRSVQQTSDNGYIITGYSNTFHYDGNDGTDYDIYLIKTNSTGAVMWTKTYGGVTNETAYSVLQTEDGEYIILGHIKPIDSGYGDVYLIRTDENGDTIWTKTYGGAGNEEAYSMKHTSDGGFIIAGKSSSGEPGYKFYLLKIDRNGKKQWTRIYTGKAPHKGSCARSVQQTSDGGYIAVGYMEMPLGIYIVKTDTQDDTTWTRFYGGGGSNNCFAIKQTSDGGYIMTGGTSVCGSGDYDVYLLKTNSHGDSIWLRTYGGKGNDLGKSLCQTSDGGYIITGQTQSRDNDNDVFIIKTDAKGDTMWTKTYGGKNHDVGNSIRLTSDGGYVIIGNTYSFGIGSPTYSNIYFLKTDVSGNIQMSKIIAGDNHEHGNSVEQTVDGGYIIIGSTCSFGAGNNDIYLVKLDANGDTVWTKTCGGCSYDSANDGKETMDGGYIVVGSTHSFGSGNSDIYLVKFDTNGDTVWTRTFGDEKYDAGTSVQQIQDEGYIIVGYGAYPGKHPGVRSFDAYLIRTDENGDTMWTTMWGQENAEVYGHSVRQTSDNGYIVAGYTVVHSGMGNSYIYIVKTNPDVSVK